MSIKTLMVIASLTFVGCSGSNQVGKCIGLVGDENPNLAYEISLRNTVWSFVGLPFVLPPIVWATHYVKCPVGYKGVTK